MKINYYKETINNKKIYNVKFLNTSDSSDDFDKSFYAFLSKWRDLYNKKEQFCFKFDTTEINSAPIKYCFIFSNFIKELKSEPVQYLEFSIINIKSNIIRCLLNLILSIQKPVAPIYITKSIDEMHELFGYLSTNNILLESFVLINKITVIKSEFSK